MSQVNIQLPPDLEEALNLLMKARGLSTATDAVRLAIQEALAREARASRSDFREWIGIGCGAPQNSSPRFSSDNDLWS